MTAGSNQLLLCTLLADSLRQTFRPALQGLFRRPNATTGTLTLLSVSGAVLRNGFKCLLGRDPKRSQICPLSPVKVRRYSAM